MGSNFRKFELGSASKIHLVNMLIKPDMFQHHVNPAQVKTVQFRCTGNNKCPVCVEFSWGRRLSRLWHRIVYTIRQMVQAIFKMGWKNNGC